MIDPIKDLVYLTPIYDSDKSEGGIIIPDMAMQRCDQGIVKYIGPDVKHLRAMDYVMFPNYSGTLMKVEGEGTIIIMAEEAVTCILANVADGTNVDGLFFMDKNGEYFTANYEAVFEFVAAAIQKADWYKRLKADNRKRSARDFK